MAELKDFMDKPKNCKWRGGKCPHREEMINNRIYEKEREEDPIREITMQDKEHDAKICNACDKYEKGP